MQVIEDGAALERALAGPLDPALKLLLARRRDQLLHDTGGEYELGELALFVVVEPGDPPDALEATAGWPVVTEPAFEWVEDHGGWYEAVTVLSDDGFGTVLLVPDDEGVDALLLARLRDEATPPAPITAAIDLPEQPTAR